MATTERPGAGRPPRELSLSRDDLTDVLVAVSNLHDANGPDEFAHAALREVLRLVACDLVSLNEMDPVAGRIAYLAEPDTFGVPAGGTRVLGALLHEHPLIVHLAKTGDGSPRRISDFWTTAEFHASELYRRFYRELGTEYQVGFALAAPQPTVLAIAASRQAYDFSDRDLAVLDLLRPHLAQGWRNAQDRELLHALLHAGDRDPEVAGDVKVVGLGDEPSELTEGALATLERYFGPPAPAEELPPRVRHWVSAQRTAPVTPEDSEVRLPQPLTAIDAGQRAVLRYLPAHGPEPGAIVVRQVTNRTRLDRIRAVGLTQREAEIVALLADGLANAAIAARLHISAGTVKKHLDNIYDKLGVRGRGAVVAFILDIGGRELYSTP